MGMSLLQIGCCALLFMSCHKVFPFPEPPTADVSVIHPDQGRDLSARVDGNRSEGPPPDTKVPDGPTADSFVADVHDGGPAEQGASIQCNFCMSGPGGCMIPCWRGSVSGTITCQEGDKNNCSCDRDDRATPVLCTVPEGVGCVMCNVAADNNCCGL